MGGILIKHPYGVEGHSDADVILHSICDALLGAAGLGDIGKHFPDTDMAFKGIDSKILLKETYRMVLKKKFKVINTDTTLSLQEPKIATYILAMRNCIGKILKISPFQISIKATTSEGMGFIGRKEGVAAHSVCLLRSFYT